MISVLFQLRPNNRLSTLMNNRLWQNSGSWFLLLKSQNIVLLWCSDNILTFEAFIHGVILTNSNNAYVKEKYCLGTHWKMAKLSFLIILLDIFCLTDWHVSQIYIRKERGKWDGFALQEKTFRLFFRKVKCLLGAEKHFFHFLKIDSCYIW